MWQVKQEVQKSTDKYSFLVVSLNAPSHPIAPPREPPCANELVDSRMQFLDTSASRHWQFDELRRAQWSTMMLLAALSRPERE